MTTTLANRLAGENWVVDETFTEDLPAGERLSGVDFDGCTFEGVSLSGAALIRCSLRDTTFRGCELSWLDLTDSRFTFVGFEDCRLLGTSFATTHPTILGPALEFTRCRMDYTSFRALELAGSTFRECRLHEADFAEATLSKVSFAGSDLTGASFGRSDLSGADFVTATGMAIDVRETVVRGARFALTHANRLLSPFGVELV